ncbi:MAG: tetraacyldisaccharide 4'-kinase, partial [Pseudomonadota bacterium]
RYRMDKAKAATINAPVVCIGNLTAGGTGKTPTAIALAKLEMQAKLKPGFVSRGYGGIHVNAHQVDIASDTASAVGDEPLLLARVAPTIVGQNRAASAGKLVDGGCDFIIMDDGFQSRSLHYDYALVTLDAQRGIGNGQVIPAGPLRAPLIDQMRHATAILRIGEGDAGDVVIRAAARAAKPFMHAKLMAENPEALAGKQVLAFTGIGNPQKFFDTLSTIDCWVGASRSFGDHHAYTEAEAQQLLDKASAENLELVTTEKDAVRLTHSEGPLAALRQKAYVLPVSLQFGLKTDGPGIISTTIEQYEQRRLAAK